MGVGNGIILGALMWKSRLVPGPLVLIRAILILFDVVDPGAAIAVLVLPEILWEGALGIYPLIKGFKTPPSPLAAWARGRLVRYCSRAPFVGRRSIQPW